MNRARVALALGALPAALLALVLLGSACGETKLVGAGGECLQATDCEEGLICAPAGGKRACTSDLSKIEKTDTLGGGEEDGAAAADGPAQTDAPGNITDAPARDTNTPRDTSVPPDTQPPADTGAG
jgi:hypothetical protein